MAESIRASHLRRRLALLASLLAIGLAAPASAQVREREPNDSLAQRNVLAPGVALVAGSIAPSIRPGAEAELASASPATPVLLRREDRGDLDFFTFTGLPPGGTFTAKTGVASTLGRYVNGVLVAFTDGRRGLSGQVPATGRVVLVVGGVHPESGRAHADVLTGIAAGPVDAYALSISARRRAWFTPPPITPGW